MDGMEMETNRINALLK